ncbi:Bifunctional monothiol glutaredoxin-S16, chloroplastic [Capsicum annuum]|uniref:Bifunctional monothiol glutaredoxin-S16, chloroplastic n=1 Tax=Capsicum annuum TaxID=4072 RepID=A0A1U8E3T7_CAPAN|nr:bifunctional monothiol glutaredoxin-S16, chloroplastic [Capsicum annuum]KAF3640934.1 Bifunctional monothiol glutaredoxin-S16, chloroplastic [Capsicum annuum]PHT72767.1 Bifunctional monothiol glutaredoxin-S16, chloroplastic [Capsicum annuum]
MIKFLLIQQHQFTLHHFIFCLPSMATFNMSFLTQPHSSLPNFPNFSSQNTPSFSSYSLPKTSLIFPSFTVRPQNGTITRRIVVVAALKKLSETDPLTVPVQPNEISARFPNESGVYAVYDSNGDLQFVGISRNIAASVVSHKNSVPQFCSSVKVGVVDEPNRTALTESWKSWMEEHIATSGKVPPGNEPGNSTWVRQPPKKKADLRLTPGRHVQLTVPLEDLIDRLVKENKVVAFIKGSRSAPQCGFSQRVVGILESEGVDYESVDVLDEEYNAGLRETLKNYSNWPTFPQIFVKGELVGGCDILTSMYEKGELASLFKS